MKGVFVMCKIYTVSSLNNKPFIRLTGKWLEKNGFNKGDKIRLFYDDDILVLTKINDKELLENEKNQKILSLEKQLKDLKEN